MKKLKVNEKVSPIEYFSTMGCRTANGFDINFEDSYRNNIHEAIYNGRTKDNVVSGAQKDGRGNICPVTIILPTIAMEVKQQLNALGDVDDHLTKEDRCFHEFMIELDKAIFDAKDALIERFNYIASQSPASAKFMYENNTMSGYVPSEGIVSALKHGTLALGQIGLAEALEILIGTDQTTELGMEHAKMIESLFNMRCAQFKEETKLNFGVYYTPAENLCYTSFLKWKEKYGEMENVTFYIDSKGERHEKEYFTNSMHVPVYKEMSPFDKIDIESQLTSYSNAGCITYIEAKHEIVDNIEALEKMVNYAMNKDIPYFAINLPNDHCEDCGYQGSIDDCCPKCGSKHISHLRRVTGYLTGDYKSAFNYGKQVETEQRVKHNEKTDF